MAHQHHRIAIGQGKVKVVQSYDHADAEVMETGQDVELMTDVKVIGGFIKEEHLRLLCQCSRQMYSLSFSS
ncbi:MAG: hypothetical protein R5N60_03005 [Cutibacterium granulosum]|nr:hypothetical protein [Cutibacterium granulosum]MEA5639073.1 hypothetical protein [Cutibacterium granulosum]MEA5646414.1 hypothetical protein [Cutibacterium granulosum]